MDLGTGGRLRVQLIGGKALLLRIQGPGFGQASPALYHGPLALGHLRAQWVIDGVFPVPKPPSCSELWALKTICMDLLAFGNEMFGALGFV